MERTRSQAGDGHTSTQEVGPSAVVPTEALDPSAARVLDVDVERAPSVAGEDYVNQMLYVDAKTFLPDLDLAYSDGVLD